LKTVMRAFGMGPSTDLSPAQKEAQDAQQRAAFAQQEQAQRLAAEKTDSGRVMASGGRQLLAFGGNTSGLATALGG
jgi:hypothetical protein